jgi:hypothetical protein
VYIHPVITPYIDLLPRMNTVFEILIYCTLLFIWRNSPTRTRTASFLRFLDHIEWLTTIGIVSLDEGSARRRDLYLTTHDTHNTSEGMVLAITWSYRLRSHALRPLGHLQVQIYKVVQIWPGQTVTCLHTISPGHIWTTLYIHLANENQMLYQRA